jgi:pyruvate,water dikinase
MPFVLKADRITKQDIKIVGGKSANLAELINAKFPVPDAFFITTESYEKFLESNDIKNDILKIVNNVNYSDVDSLRNASEKIKNLILKSKIPENIKDSIIGAYKEMYGAPPVDIEFVKVIDYPFVAVRSSAITEDIAKASSAGQYDTFLNIKGEINLLDAIKRAWASLYTPRAIYYRYKNNQPQNTSIGLIVQKMINSNSAGVAFTINPINQENNILIEAAWGLGETLVQGQVEPDRYIVDKQTGKILEKFVGKKHIERIRDLTGKTIKQNVPENRIEIQVLDDKHIVTLAAYCKKIEDHYKFPQDIEWAVERGKIYILQTRAVTTLKKPEEHEKPTGNLILEGFGVSPGIARGKVNLIRDISELYKIEKGDILVTEMTSPDYVVAMEKSNAIITNSGGSTCHAAIVSRELGIPCIVGTKNATEILKEGDEITVDATHGKIYSGEVEEEIKEEIPREGIETITEVKVNLAFPETAERAKHADGVGLLRIEHMLTKSGMHPFEFIRQNRQEELINILVENIEKIARVFYPKKIWIRTLDARTDEYKNLQGGKSELKEDNPMLGNHGIRRDVEEPELLKAEFLAFKKLQEQGLDNIEVMLPFVINVSELKSARRIAEEVGLRINFGIMIETPGAALNIEEFCKEEISFISFGSNDLTQLVLGIDRNNEKLINLFDEMHPSMLKLIKDVIWTCKKHNVKTSICGEAPSNSEEMVEFLINSKIDSISVNIDAIDKVKNWVSKIEKKRLL